MNTIFKIDYFCHLRVAKVVLIYGVVLITILFALFFYADYDIYLIRVLTAAYGLVFIFPSIILHYSYYLENKNIVINKIDGILEIHDLKLSTRYKLTNSTVKSINIYASATLVDWGTSGFLPHESYFYVVFETTGGKLILTSLIYPDIMNIQLQFREVKVDYIKTFYAMIN